MSSRAGSTEFLVPFPSGATSFWESVDFVEELEEEDSEFTRRNSLNMLRAQTARRSGEARGNGINNSRARGFD